MTITEQVKQSASPKAAILLLAAALDELLAKPAAPAADQWDSWDDEPAEPVMSVQQRIDLQTQANKANAALIQAKHNVARIAELRERLAEPGLDGEDKLALEAQLRLATETGQSIDVTPEARGHMATVVEDTDSVQVSLPAPEKHVRLARLDFAVKRKLNEACDSPLTDEEFNDAFSKGGPLWLYMGNRDAVMLLPAEWRQAFVRDIELQSPLTAQEVARDILKDTAPGTAEITLEALKS